MKNHSLQSHCLTLGTDIRLCFPVNPETFSFGRTGELMDSPIGILFPFNVWRKENKYGNQSETERSYFYENIRKSEVYEENG